MGLPSCYEHPVVTNVPRRLRKVLGAHPAAADGLFAAAIAGAALISVKAIYDEMTDMDHNVHVPAALPIVVAMLALTAPLAWRRRYPLGVAIAVVTAFLSPGSSWRCPKNR